MFTIYRTVRGVTETLKDAQNQFDQTFDDSVTAELMAKKLNMDLILMDHDHWIVKEV
ncbi:hypothetical protein JCM19045_584 [Bacillus sp. JCM 19045]|uniref:Uncharacterized protein n=1 Tax=Shouchella xiaoxiensis TaxID=766895 RepID=A0ABS2SP56_9BACI|nr:hypothetical protein [Shouchella xiaoxiensis]MBM7837291.1 hypothetical protein [Shouchella xiaoxiensis]GAF11480.1 hypothetical protein JCM19045_584 [Bacillus sp. JCM 19045]